MNWQTYLRRKSRDSRFLWRLAISILVAGLLLGFAARWLPASMTGSLIGARAGELTEYYDRIDSEADAGNWWTVWKMIPKGMWMATLPGPTLVAALTGVCWLVFIIQAGQPGSKDGIRVWLALVAVVLGVLSIWPTLFSIYYQERQWGIVDSAEVVDGLRFYILGVGLREEVCKLLLCLPLVPFIIQRGSQREAMLVAACVGLGFAMEENISYFAMNPTSSIDRFLTANFLHMSLTGLIGLAVCRAIWWPKQCGTDTIAIVLLAIVLHGVFDALIVLPALSDYSIGSMIIYILLAYRFFQELRSWWQPRGETISLTATFVVAVSLVGAATFAYFAAATDVQSAMAGIAAPGVSTAIFVYMFLREMPESMVG